MASATTDRRQGLTGDKGFKAPVQAATTANIVLSGEQTIDGVAVKAIGINGYPDRILVWNQTNPIDNGIWDVSTASWTRSQDANGSQDLVTGTMGLVTGGATYTSQQWILTTTGIISPGSTSLAFQVGIPALPILGASSGSSLIGFIQSGAGAATRTAQEKLRDVITSLDYITDPLERAAILAGTSTIDHTTEIQNAINIAGSTRRLRWLGIVNTKALTSSASVDWVFEGGARIKQFPATYATDHIILTGPKIRLEDAIFDGNQSAMIAGQGSNGLRITGVSATLIRVSTPGFNGIGYQNTSDSTGLKRTMHLDCHFDDSAGLGLQTSQAAYMDFIGGTAARNGWGFQNSPAALNSGTVGIAFGTALRMRSHHINFIGFSSYRNGKDGMNVNQGSYEIKHIGCLAYGNQDGGFTVASDNTGTGLPGEGEACYDIFYDATCEAYDNYTSGFVAYQTCHNVTWLGRSYNNHRLAGDIAVASSYFNGVYYAGGSTGINVDANVYDDRQVRSITAIAGGVLTATGWVAGTMVNYPKVAIYAGADWSFRGYAKITAESAGSVTITPTTFNGVTLGSILVGDYVSQAVQHNGVQTDNNCQGIVSAQGAGHRLGPIGGTGRLIQSGGFANGQNILLPKERLSYTELLVNPTFDASTANWAFNTPGGGSQNYHTGTFKRSAGSLQLIAGSSDAIADGTLIANSLDAVNGEFVEYGIWSYASSRGDTYAQLFWIIGGNTFSTTISHPGGGWRYLKVGGLIPVGSTSAFPRLGVAATKTGYFDTVSFKAIDSHMDSREFTFPSRSLPL